jgi:protein-L-isoaspartate(D-aspartate) O-methyltransferase
VAKGAAIPGEIDGACSSSVTQLFRRNADVAVCADSALASLSSRDDTQDNLAQQRARMVEQQLRARGLRDERVLAAMAKVPREEFVAAENRPQAYGDHPLPIGAGQTISQPYIVAAMLQLLELRAQDRVLEIGTGTGYEAAVLAELVAEVWTIERHPDLAQKAHEIMARLGYSNVHAVHGDGSHGLPEHAPFDKIVVAAGAPRIPQELIAQLTDDGRLVLPVGSRHEQQLQLVRRVGNQVAISNHELCRFVPLVGEGGWEVEH